MIAEAIYLLYAGKKDRRAAINRRVKLQEKKISQEQVLIQLRKERGLDGRSFLSMESLRKLRIQSGITMPMPKFFADHIRRGAGGRAGGLLLRSAAAFGAGDPAVPLHRSSRSRC